MIAAVASEEEEPGDEFASTIIALACAPDFTASLHIGDGLALAISDDGNPVLASLPERGEYANETHFATDQDWRGHARCTFVPTPSAAIVVCSDGAQADLIFPNSGGPNWSRACALGRRLLRDRPATFNDWLSRRLTAPERDEIEDDDTTLIVAARSRAVPTLAARR
jgi:hypothetical protein